MGNQGSLWWMGQIIWWVELNGVDRYNGCLESEITTQIAKLMGPTWGPAGSCRPQMGPMLAPWTLLSRYIPHIRRVGGYCGLVWSRVSKPSVTATERRINSVTRKPPDGLFSNLAHTLVMIVFRIDRHFKVMGSNTAVSEKVMTEVIFEGFTPDHILKLNPWNMVCSSSLVGCSTWFRSLTYFRVSVALCTYKFCQRDRSKCAGWIVFKFEIDVGSNNDQGLW